MIKKDKKGKPQQQQWQLETSELGERKENEKARIL